MRHLFCLGELIESIFPEKGFRVEKIGKSLSQEAGGGRISPQNLGWEAEVQRG